MKTFPLILLLLFCSVTSKVYGMIFFARAYEPVSGLAFPDPQAPTVYAGQSIKLVGFAATSGGVSPTKWFGEGLPQYGVTDEAVVQLQNTGTEARTVVFTFADYITATEKKLVVVTVLPAQSVPSEPSLTAFPICAGKNVPVTLTASSCPGQVKWYFLQQLPDYSVKAPMPEFDGLTAIEVMPQSAQRSICATCTVGGVESLGGKLFTIYPGGIPGSINLTASVDPSEPLCPWTKVNLTATGVGIVPESVVWRRKLSGYSEIIGTGLNVSSMVGDNQTTFTVYPQSNCGIQSTDIQYNVKNPTEVSGSSLEQTVALSNTSLAVISKDCKLIANFSIPYYYPVQLTDKEMTVKVNVEPEVGVYKGQPYLQRHYDFEPAGPVNQNVKYDIQLYFTQAEFDAFNAKSNVKLPSNNSPGELEKLSNLRVWQAHGLPLSQPATPANYSGGEVADYLCVPCTYTSWDPVRNCWRINITTTGFSGFFVTVAGAIVNALPVTLVNFTAAKNENSVVLDWQTSEEINSGYFEVQHGIDGKNWETLEKVNASGASKSLKNYTFRHQSPQEGENLYRLKMVDADESFAYSRIVSIKVTKSNGLQVFPNPALDQITFLNDVPLTQYQILNTSGKIMQERKLEKVTKNEVNTSALTSGIYILKATDELGENYYRKIVIKK